jgi:hypothetical protein
MGRQVGGEAAVHGRIRRPHVEDDLAGRQMRLQRCHHLLHGLGVGDAHDDEFRPLCQIAEACRLVGAAPHQVCDGLRIAMRDHRDVVAGPQQI